MNHKKKTIERLRNLNAERAALVNLPEKIRSLEDRYVAIRAARTDGDPVSGGTSNREDALIDNIAERQDLQADLEYTRVEVEIMERNLAALSANENLVLTRFYINDEKHAVDRLISDLGYEQAQIYRIKDAALERLARRLYGHVQI